MDESPKAKNWKPSGWRRVLLTAALGAAVFIPSCSEDPSTSDNVSPEPGAEGPAKVEPEAAPQNAPKPDPYLGYSR